MRWTRSVVITCWLAVFAAVIGMLSCAAPTSQEMTAQEKVAHGEYLATVSGCNDCHTPGFFYGASDPNRKLSGSELGWKGPWGVTFARNLTPDPETGIADWTEDQIVTAFRTGHRPDGSALLPPMPWPSFANFTDEDAYALAAYIKSVPPIKHKVPDAVPPDQPYDGAYVTIPPPPAWDAPRTPPAGQ